MAGEDQGIDGIGGGVTLTVYVGSGDVEKAAKK